MQNEVKETLINKRDDKYLNFHSNLCKNVNLIGIPVPILRTYAKNLYQHNDVSYLLSEIDNEYYEEIMLKGMLICLDKEVSSDMLFKRIREYVPLIDNWAICDIFCTNLKVKKCDEHKLFNFILPYFKSNKTYDIRFATVIFLSHFVSIEHMKIIFPLFLEINNHEYYTEMSIAWALSICLIKEYDYTIAYLESNNLSRFIYLKTISKAIDSYRITDNHKNYLRLMREKIKI